MEPEGGSPSEEPPKNQAVSFTVGFDEPAKKPRKIPKHLTAANKGRSEMSETSIEEKQKLAEKRRKVII